MTIVYSIDSDAMNSYSHEPKPSWDVLIHRVDSLGGFPPRTGLVGALRARTDGLKQSQVLYAGHSCRVGPAPFVVSCWISARMIFQRGRQERQERQESV